MGFSVQAQSTPEQPPLSPVTPACVTPAAAAARTEDKRSAAASAAQQAVDAAMRLGLNDDGPEGQLRPGIKHFQQYLLQNLLQAQTPT